jgi:hypothetical protein
VYDIGKALAAILEPSLVLVEKLEGVNVAGRAILLLRG